MAADKLPDALLQEVRNVLATECREMVMCEKATGENVAGQHNMMSKVFHGSAGYASVVDKLLDGKGPYASVFNKLPIENNREGNDERPSGHMLVMKDIVSCNEGAKYVAQERGFNKEAITKNGEKKLEGRNIGERAITSTANYKFALKYCDEYCQDGKLPSGKSLDDMVLYVRQKMYVHLRGGKNNRTSNRRAAGSDKPAKEFVEEDMPAKYMFNGYLVFLLYGPLGLCGITLSCLSKDGSDIKKKGRAAARTRKWK
ncbi:unknown protein [Seminavis robusta]|uniref:Uncharacterized protein n=1 Tax=Seminavis robusta TaxID=568900 RepID=A0A9N8EYY8_9STRA|nr:unknown protein [Seminavis robusta]|eukprot:Sro2979_g341460.1 n/a (257) ;mRNA; f:4340-5202